MGKNRAPRFRRSRDPGGQLRCSLLPMSSPLGVGGVSMLDSALTIQSAVKGTLILAPLKKLALIMDNGLNVGFSKRFASEHSENDEGRLV